MTLLADIFDAYSRRARLSPAILVVLPAAFYVLLGLPSLIAPGGGPAWLGLLWPVLVTAGVPFLLTNLVRSRGKRKQVHLLTAWDGFSSVRALRHRDPGSLQRRAHRRHRLEKLLDIRLPTQEEEERDPQAADQHYTIAVDQLIARVRAQADNFPLIREENAHYGFRRNLLGVKGYAVALLVICLAVDFAALTGGFPTSPDRRIIVLIASVHAVILVGWLAQVRAFWVREAADDYTARLFAALDDPRL